MTAVLTTTSVIGGTTTDTPTRDLVVGLGGGARNACVAVSTGAALLGACEQERITRVRSAGSNGSGFPDETLDELLRRSGRQRAHVAKVAMPDDVPVPAGVDTVRLDHHFAHACTAFYSSPFPTAAIVVCDDAAPFVTVWQGDGETIEAVPWEWTGIGLTDLYAGCAEAFGFRTAGKEQRMEAYARLDPDSRDERAARLFTFDTDHVEVAPDWQRQVEAWLAGTRHEQWPAVAAALQASIGDVVLRVLAGVQRRLPGRAGLCLGGTLFTNSSLNARIKRANPGEVFVPVNPGDAGQSVGAALFASDIRRQRVTPFLGPSYTGEEIKEVLDNCKLTYQWLSESEIVGCTVEALNKGHFVGWFDGAMEWGPRTLGARSILANPFAPYVLENLNRFLKRREAWRGYALSTLQERAGDMFEGPATSPFMECDYAPMDRERLRHILPRPTANVRVQTVGNDAPERFRTLLQAFGEASGFPALVNTSFNGFSEPIVCSPRDAIRVFFGTGLEMLVLGPFVVRK